MDRDTGMAILVEVFNECDPAVITDIALELRHAEKHGKYVSICGQGPSDHPDFAQWLMKECIMSISLNPDPFIETWQKLAKVL